MDLKFETLKYKLDKEVFNHFKITKTVIFHISQYNENNEGFLIVSFS